MKANTVKTQILDTFSVFSPIAKVADVKAEIKGKEYRVKISKGTITKIVSDRKAIWTPESDQEAMVFIDDLVHPKAELKVDKVESVEDVKEIEETDKVVDMPKKTQKKQKVVVDDKWIAFLEEKANETDLLKEGDTIHLRVARSHGKPVCAHVDLYTDNEKVATAGIHHRIGFATKGIDDKWTSRVEAAIKEIYRKIGNGRMIKSGKATVRINDDEIQNAEGTIIDVLSILESL